MSKERYVATIVGCGIGDSLGMAVEGWKPEQIREYVGAVDSLIRPVIIYSGKGEIVNEDVFGKLKYYTKGLKKGDYTDDTILTLAIAESIADKKGLDLGDIVRKQVDAYSQCEVIDGHVLGGFGGSTQEAFKRILAGFNPLDSGVFPGLGDGPPMKMSPLGLYMHASGDYQGGMNMARLVGRSTHLDERAIAAGVVQAHAIYSLMNDSSKDDFLASLVDTCEKQEFENSPRAKLIKRGSLLSKLEWVLKNASVENKEALDYLGNGSFAFEAYPFTVFMFQKYWDNPFEGLIATVNQGGDCDTTGAIFGALAGAKDGGIFPNKWLEILQNRERLERAGERLWELGEDV